MSNYIKPRLLSGRVKKVTGERLDGTRYEYIGLAQAEPDLGQPAEDGSVLLSLNTGTRYWSPALKIINDVVRLESGTVSNSTTTGALVVTGGVGVDGRITTAEIYGNYGRFTDLSANTVYALGGQNASSTNTGALQVFGGIGVTGNIFVAGEIIAQKLTIEYTTVTTTLVVTDDIIQTTNATNATSTYSGALVVAGGAGFGRDVWIGGILNVSGAEVVTTATIGDVFADTLQSVTNRGFTTTNQIYVANTSVSESTSTGALVVDGGVGIGQDLWVGGDIHIAKSLYLGDSLVITTSSFQENVIETLQSVTDRGNSTTNSIFIIGGFGENSNTSTFNSVLSFDNSYSDIARGPNKIKLFNESVWHGGFGISYDSLDIYSGKNTNFYQDARADNTGSLVLSIDTSSVRIRNITQTTATNTGALIVDGGASIGGNLWVNETIYSRGLQVITTASLGGLGVGVIFAGTDTALDNNYGIVTIWSTSTFESVTSRGSTTTHIIRVANTTSSTSSDSGALTVGGGVGIGENLYVKGIISAEGGFQGLDAKRIFETTSSVTVSDTGTIGKVTVTIADNTNTVFSENKVKFFTPIELANSGTISDTTSSLVLTPPGALAGQGLVIRTTTGGGLSTANTFTPGSPVTITFTDNGSHFSSGGTTDTESNTWTYTITGISQADLGSPLTGSFLAENWGVPSINQNSITFNIPGGSNGIGFVITLDKIITDPPYILSNGGVILDGNGRISLNVGSVTTSTEVSHVHLTSADPATVDLYLGDDDQYVKIVKNAGGVVVGTNSSTNRWVFDPDGSLTLPIGVTIDESNGSHFPRIVADTGKAFSVQGYGSTGSVALQWAETASTSSQIAQVGLNKFSGIAAVTLTAGTSTNDMKLWGFDETGTLTLPAGGTIADAASYIKLTPAGGTTATQALLIYPTAVDGDHLHLTAGGGSTELYLGNDYHYVKLANNGNVTVQASTGTYSATSAWTFGTDGRLVNLDGLTLTAGGQFNICTIVSAGSGYNTGSALKATTGGSGTGMTVGIGYGLSNQLASVTVVNPGTGYVDGDVITVSEGTDGTFVLTQYNELGNQGNNNFVQSNWIFGADGKLTAPGKIAVQSTASSTSTNTGALTVVGGAGIGGDLYVGGALYQNDEPILSTATINQFANQTAIYAGTDTAVSANSGTSIYIWNTSTLQSITNRGSTTTNAIRILNTATSTSTTTGALVIAGGIGIGGDLYVGNSLVFPDNLKIANSVISNQVIEAGGDLVAGSEIKVSLSTTTIINKVLNALGGGGSPPSLTSQGQVAVDSNKVVIAHQIINDAGALSSLTSQNQIEVNASNILIGYKIVETTTGTTTSTFSGWTFNSTGNLTASSTASSTSTTTGALVVAGGVGIGENLFVKGSISAEGGFLGLNANSIYQNTSSVTVIDNTATQQISLIVANVTATLITSTLTQINTVVSITNTASSTTTDTGALVVAGGVGIGENLFVKGSISAEGGFLGLNANSIYQNTSSVTVTDTGSVSQVVITIADTTNTTFSRGLVDIAANLDVQSVRWKNSTTNAVSVYQVYNHVTQSLDTIFV